VRSTTMRRVLISTLSLLGLCGCGDDGRPVYRSFDKTLLELAKEDPNLSTFAELVTVAGLDAALGGNVLYPKTSVGALGEVAEFEDSEGNRVALHKAANQRP